MTFRHTRNYYTKKIARLIDDITSLQMHYMNNQLNRAQLKAILKFMQDNIDLRSGKNLQRVLMKVTQQSGSCN